MITIWNNDISASPEATKIVLVPLDTILYELESFMINVEGNPGQILSFGTNVGLQIFFVNCLNLKHVWSLS